ncbi:50S ribosomal protein L11 methyltransferase [Salegentibacter salarius]|uniref:Ribosomal protein L11 methyltransferase n=1 Tax=Salegentibacter salarius TaxID=435906 RepID=A0A2N0TT63_9FLAO|nr:50S ribosomal protein L11 methyltransferase [Salegentibacter salarius]OEY72091.1 ribosomal protein L11 methyltransferase [Salegentibacter salarius]PKD17921.1 ribosomal protein L11 methyltransferase [Salegentibacter salarius]SLK04411.1 ribosomal protein L11 methyltransferase [Salegentibacter salarius]
MSSNYLEFKFKIEPLQPASEILVAELGYLGFESFVEEEDGITAYIPAEEYEDDLLAGVHILQSEDFEITYSKGEIEQVNWNEEWEKNFNPIMVNDICSVRAPFHPEPDVEYDIVIEPKMSFGTGHHATTHMMIQHILKNDWNDKAVLDMGCGTGVLAILASLKGAKFVDAIDIDNWCYQNTMENVGRNDCDNINVEEGGAELLQDRKYDMILANINRNILLRDLPIYVDCLNKGGDLFLSGFYEEDIPVIKEACIKLGLTYIEHFESSNWVAVKFSA